MRLWDNTTLDVVLFSVMRYHIREIEFIKNATAVIFEGDAIYLRNDFL